MGKKPVEDRVNRLQESACHEDVAGCGEKQASVPGPEGDAPVTEGATKPSGDDVASRKGAEVVERLEAAEEPEVAERPELAEKPGAAEKSRAAGEAPEVPEGFETLPEDADQATQIEELSARVAELEERLSGAAQEVERIASERDTWQSKATALFDQYNRAKADFNGFRRRTERDFEDRLTREKGDFIKGLLEVMDNFERFLKAAEGRASGDKNFDAFYKGVVMIQKQLMDVLLREGVEPIESPVGELMNPEYHEAVAAQDGGGEHGTVIEELQTGYMYKGTVLRATRVKVIR